MTFAERKTKMLAADWRLTNAAIAAQFGFSTATAYRWRSILNMPKSSIRKPGGFKTNLLRCHLAARWRRDGWTWNQIGLSLGVSRERASQLARAAKSSFAKAAENPNQNQKKYFKIIP